MNYDDINLKILRVFGLNVSEKDRIYSADIKLRPGYPPILVLEKYVDTEEETTRTFKISEITE